MLRQPHEVFIMVAGDMAHALPNDDEGYEDWQQGDFPPLRYFSKVF